MKLKIILLLLPILLLITSISTVYSGEILLKEDGDKILLKSREFIPDTGIGELLKTKIRTNFPGKTYTIIQFYSIPDNKKNLEENGIKLLSYIPNNAWFASISTDKPENILELSNIRSVTEILPGDKISPAIKNKNYIATGGKVNLLIILFKDVDLDDASSKINKYGEIVDRYYSINSLKITIDEILVLSIANEDIVQWIDVIDFLPKTHNDGNRENTGVNILQTSPYDLSGVNVVTAEWDGGWADITHDDLQGRIILGDSATCGAGDSGTCGTATHATHVAGTMLGNGTLSETEGGTALQWRGMAPNATVISYEWWDDSTELNNEYAAAINIYDTSLSQNSWGYTYFNCGSDCSGGYDSFAGELDGIVRGSKGKKISQIWSAGNNRPNNCDSGNYDCISFPATAKNIITIGATNSNDDSMTSFSSWGPTNDGRLKPEVTAPGCQVGGDNGVTSTIPGDAYNTFCGTSMAAPTVSGIVALMYEEYSNKDYPLPSTIKAILIHNAKDLGNSGPDYSFGYGRVNATASVDMIRNDTTNNLIKEDVISNGETKEFDMTVPQGVSSVKVTLVWDDPSATVNADPTLVNDLDLILISNGNLFSPWVLDPNNPTSPATTGTNTLDNVEQVYITNPQAGIWTVRVNGFIPDGPQNFTLVSDHSFSIQPKIAVKTFRDSSYSQEDKFFDAGETIFVQATVTAGGEAQENNTVTADLILSNGTIEDSLILTEVGGGIYRNSWDSTSHTNDVYLINVTAIGNGTTSDTNQFHLYSGNGVSAYLFDFNEDGEDDNVLENRHIVSVFKRQLNNSPIIYYEQKDTNVSYSFLVSPYENATSRGGISTDEFPVTLNFSFCSSGENLQSASMKMELLKINPRVVDPPLDFSNQICGVDCNECTNNDACAIPTCKDKGGAKAYIDDIRVDATVVEPNSDITVTIDTVQSFTNDCSAIYYQPPGGGFQEVFCRCPAQFASETNSVTFNVGNVGGIGIIRATMNDGGGSCVVCSTNNGENDRMDITIANVTEGSFDFLADLNISVNTEDVDYLIYNLRNFNETVFPDSIFSDIYGTIGSSANDDRYHLQTGEDDLITSLPANQWNNFNSNYSIVYDNSSSSDSIDNNVIAFVRFNETAESFQDIGLWNGSEGLRIRYNTTTLTGSDEINYILAFTKGDWQTIDRWMPDISQGIFPTPNFLTPPGDFVSITLIGFPVDFGSQDAGQMDINATGNPFTIRIDPETTMNVDVFQKGDDFASNPNILGIGNMTWSLSNDASSSFLVNKTFDAGFPVKTNVSPSTDVGIFYWLDVPSGLSAGNYNTTIFIKAIKTGLSP